VSRKGRQGSGNFRQRTLSRKGVQFFAVGLDMKGRNNLADWYRESLAGRCGRLRGGAISSKSQREDGGEKQQSKRQKAKKGLFRKHFNGAENSE